MARSRNIKPGFFTNDELGELDPLARLLFAGLWCHADREGRLEDRPKKLKAEILPYDDCDCDGLLSGLHGAGFILRYVVDGIAYIQCLNFLKHQNPHIKEQVSTIPAPDKNGASTVQEPNKVKESPEVARLIPSSLIPDSLIKPPAAKAADPVKDEIWKTGKTLLANGGDTKDAASFLGKLCKEYGQILVLQAVRDCVANTPAEPKAWLVARCQERRQKEKGNGKFNAVQYNAKQLAKSLDAGATPQVCDDLHGQVHEVLPRLGNG